MKMKLDFKKIAARLAQHLLRFRGLIIFLVAIGLIGYSIYLFSRIIDIRPDQAYLSEQRKKLDESKISFDKKTIQSINQLQQINPKIDLSNVGKSDPFSP
jgi:hypothetical protein